MPPKPAKHAVPIEYLSGMGISTAAPPSVPRKSEHFAETRAFDFGIARLRVYGDAGSLCAFARWSDDTNTFFTIGHSTRTIVEFVDLLRESGVDPLSLRSMPRSRTNPQFNQETLPETLAPWQIGYQHIAELGGLRGNAYAESSPNAYWRVRSFRNYADYALTAPFAAGLARLRECGSEHRCVIMCAEAVWWRCHRRIIADYLLAAAEQVKHILGKSHVDVANLTPGASFATMRRWSIPPRPAVRVQLRMVWHR